MARRRPQYEDDRAFLQGTVETLFGESVKVYTGADMDLTTFLGSKTIKPPAVCIAFMGFSYSEGMENSGEPGVDSYSVFVCLGAPGAAFGAKRSDAEQMAREIVRALVKQNVYELVATPGTYRSCTVSNGQNLFLTLGFDAFEIQLTIN